MATQQPISTNDDDLIPYNIIEALADAEHEGWAHWQRYLHSVCIPNPDGSLTIPADKVERWTRQIETPYADLTEREKESDREQVRKIFPILNDLIGRADKA